MSAWSIGADARALTALADNQSSLKTYIDRVVKWIPGDVLGLYVAGVTALGASDPRVWLLIVAILLAPVVVVLGALGMPAAQQPGNIPGRAVLAALATIIWTLTVPGSGWQQINKVAENPKTVAVVAAIAGLVFGLIADLIVKDD